MSALEIDTDSPVSADTQEEIIEEVEHRAISFEPAFSSPPDNNSVDLEWAYGPLKEFVRMTIADDYQNLLILDAAGGLGKTYQITSVLEEQYGSEGSHVGLADKRFTGWLTKSGHTTPLSLYETLWQARHGDVVFLDDVDGITRDSKCIEMLKAATDTTDSPNTITWDSSRTPKLGRDGQPVSQFTFRGKIIMSFNETPDSKHYSALSDRCVGGSAYTLSFSYDERLRLIREIAKRDEISDLSYETRQQLVDWIEQVSTPAMDISIRTLNAVCEIREYAERSNRDVDWQHMCLEAFDVDYEQYLVQELADTDLTDDEKAQLFANRTGQKTGAFYDARSRLNNR